MIPGLSASQEQHRLNYKTTTFQSSDLNFRLQKIQKLLPAFYHAQSHLCDLTSFCRLAQNINSVYKLCLLFFFPKL